VLEDGQAIGRIRLARERTPAIRVWNVTVNIPGLSPFGSAGSLAEAKEAFRTGWEAFKAKHGPEELAAAYEAMNYANRPERYRK
jgi:hypothetical protein